MGIPRFFQYIKHNFPNTVDYFTLNNEFPEMMDHLYIDANGIIHNSVRKIVFHKPKQTVRLAKLNIQDILQNTVQKDFKELWKDIFDDILNTIDMLFKFVKPKYLLFIAIDGSAPMAKQSQQRQRRFRSALETKYEDFKKFDKNSITPGTTFMNHLAHYLEYNIREKMEKDPFWKSRKVIFSPSNEKGEGEHKIINYIRTLPNKQNIRHCMHGLDADLFMLSLSTQLEHFWLLREDVFCEDALLHFHFANVGLLRKELNTTYNPKNKNIDRLVNDFIFLSFLVGNDFLHNTPMCHDLYWSIPTMMELRKDIFQDENDYITTSNGKGFHISKFMKFLEHIKDIEPYAIADLRHENTFEYPAVNTALIKDNTLVNIDIFRTHYYKKANITDIDAFCKEYIQGLEWVCVYYHQKPTNWKWVYPFHYTPLLVDVYEYLAKKPKISKISKLKTDSIEPYEQLLCVLPPKSIRNIPRELHEIVKSPVMKEFYPKDFDIDVEGKARDWQGVALLPFLDYTILHTEYMKDKYKKVRTQARNKEKIKKEYVYDDSVRYDYNNHYGNIQDCHIRTREVE